MNKYTEYKFGGTRDKWRVKMGVEIWKMREKDKLKNKRGTNIICNNA